MGRPEPDRENDQAPAEPPHQLLATVVEGTEDTDSHHAADGVRHERSDDDPDQMNRQRRDDQGDQEAANPADDHLPICPTLEASP